MRVERPIRAGLAGAVIVLACAAVPAGAATKTKSRTCGSGVCSTALSSAPPPATSPGGGGGGGGGGGSSVPPPAQSVPPSPFSTLNVKVEPRTTRHLQSGSQLVEKLNAGRRLVCPGYTRRDKSWFEFMLAAKTRIGITYQITDTIHDTTRDGVHICAGLGYSFKTFAGRPARRATLPDGTRGYVGLLPDCKEDANGKVLSSGPCVSFIIEANDKNSSTGVDTILGIRIPATTQADPWAAG